MDQNIPLFFFRAHHNTNETLRNEREAGHPVQKKTFFAV